MRYWIVTAIAVCTGCAGEAPTGTPPQDANSNGTIDAPATVDAPTTTFSFFITSTGGPNARRAPPPVSLHPRARRGARTSAPPP